LVDRIFRNVSLERDLFWSESLLNQTYIV
jgi:hypothetical protein